MLLWPINRTCKLARTKSVIDIHHGDFYGKADRSRNAAIDVAPVSDIVDDNFLGFSINLINDTIIPNPNPKELFCR